MTTEDFPKFFFSEKKHNIKSIYIYIMGVWCCMIYSSGIAFDLRTLEGNIFIWQRDQTHCYFNPAARWYQAVIYQDDPPSVNRKYSSLSHVYLDHWNSLMILKIAEVRPAMRDVVVFFRIPFASFRGDVFGDVLTVMIKFIQRSHPSQSGWILLWVCGHHISSTILSNSSQFVGYMSCIIHICHDIPRILRLYP